MWRLSLIKHGIHYRDALDLDPDEDFPIDRSWMLTFAVGFGMIDGRQFDWQSMRWRRQ